MKPSAPNPPASPVVFITGGSSGIGRCAAALFGRNGWSVGLIARGEVGLAAAAADIPGARTAIADVSDGPALLAASQRLADELGTPDVWINCAGNGVYGRFGTVTQAEYDRVTAVTYGGTVNGCRAALSMMSQAGRGTIINVCSAAAFHGLPLMTSYAGAKAAVRGFAQALRAELRIERSRIRISTLFPPAVNTPFFSHAVSHMAFPARPAPPVYQPEVVAAAIWQAALHPRAEILVSGTTVAFSLAQRLSPALIAWCMTRLGFDGQLTTDAGARLLLEPTLFAPSTRASPIHGPFGGRARRQSVQVRLTSLLYSLPLVGRAGVGLTRPPRLPLPAIPVLPLPHPAPEG